MACTALRLQLPAGVLQSDVPTQACSARPRRTTRCQHNHRRRTPPVPPLTSLTFPGLAPSPPLPWLAPSLPSPDPVTAHRAAALGSTSVCGGLSTALDLLDTGGSLSTESYAAAATTATSPRTPGLVRTPGGSAMARLAIKVGSPARTLHGARVLVAGVAVGRAWAKRQRSRRHVLRAHARTHAARPRQDGRVLCSC